MDGKKREKHKLGVIAQTRMHKNKSGKRFIEIDLLRGLAIIIMIFAHILWDLDYFGILPLNTSTYSVLHKTVAPLFFVLVGISVFAGRTKKQLTTDEEKKYNTRLAVRGLKLFTLGMLLTIASLFVLPERPVFFGVLHCIGLSIVLCVFFLKYRFYNILFAVIILFTGFVFSNINISNPSLLHLLIGIYPSDIWSYTVDYFPIIPWLGFTLLGIAIGDCLYCGNTRKFRLPALSNYTPAKIFSWVGQHSLIIYLIHQPVIAGALYVFVWLI